MSSMDFSEGVATWETGGQVFWTRLQGASEPIAAPGTGKNRKHPRVAVNGRGEVLLVWTEGTGWQKGGELAWQKFDRAGKALGEMERLPGIPAWSFAAVVARPEKGVTILY